MTISRRRFALIVGTAGAAAALPPRPRLPDGQSPIADLLPYYAESARRNITVRTGGRAILSSRIYPKGTFMRDAFYGPMALGDVELSRDCYRWFERTQLPNGQILTAAGFTPDDQAMLTPMEDDSSLLFIIWSAWLRRRGVDVDAAAVERAFGHVQAHVDGRGHFVSPGGPFRYWADTVNPEAPECITHNQGLYALALKAMRILGLGAVSEAQVAEAKQRYAGCYDPAIQALPLGRDTWWASKQDISTVFPEFLFRWAFRDRALPDAAIVDTVKRMVRTASVTKDGKIAGIKVICDNDGGFLPAERFHAPSLNAPGDYQNGGYWPMYTLTALALSYRIRSTRVYKAMAEALVIAELDRDHVSKEVIKLGEGKVGETDPRRDGYTWNALIAPALKWAGMV